jgi:hypothetical protein
MNGSSHDNNKNNKKHPGDKNSDYEAANQGSKNIAGSNDNEEEIELFEDVHPSIKKSVKTILTLQGVTGPISSVLDSKINEKHIDKILEMTEKSDERRFTDSRHLRKFRLFYILIGVALFVFLTLFLVGKDTELFKDIIKLFIAFVGGMGAGYGIKHYVDNK